jgi:hypothetical protein
MNVFQRLAKAMAEAKYVQKSGFNGFHKYSYAKESDYIEAVRPALLKQGLVVFPISQKTTKEGELTTIEMVFRFQNTEDPKDFFDVPSVGQGVDKGDKGAYKAMTGAKKYMISLAMLIEAGDDAEADETTDKRTETKKAYKPDDAGLGTIAAVGSTTAPTMPTTAKATSNESPTPTATPKASWRKAKPATAPTMVAPVGNGHTDGLEF